MTRPEIEPSARFIEHPDGTVVRIEGAIDERFNLDGFTGRRDVVVLDIDGVTRINSVGIKRWKTALTNLDAQYLCFVRCRPAVVSQFNIVSGFGCGGELISFYLPYLCPHCDRAFALLLDMRADRGRIQSLTAPEQKCTCGEKADFDDFAEYYLRYAREAPIPEPPAAVQTLIDAEGLARGT